MQEKQVGFIERIGEMKVSAKLVIITLECR